ncbi:Uncharacterised protein [Pantoea agglomerans]|uniref:Uncharacterized protein n=1 Tax=Enterobacter agglomerans TaxID=549 RepID=A0A379AEN0_ENTAG|nr:Uncharacterised protein [Pantoea agglomerans]
MSRCASCGMRSNPLAIPLRKAKTQQLMLIKIITKATSLLKALNSVN